MRARDNPFAVSRMLSVRYRLAGVTWPELIDRLRRLDGRAAVVGPHGTGKTTLLEDLEPHVQALGYRTVWIRLRAEQPVLPASWLRDTGRRLTKRDFVLLDGAEQMSRWAWARFRASTKKAAGLLITSHQAGLLPTLHQCATDATLLGDIIDTLLDRPGASSLRFSAALHARHEGNIREALREMYDRWAHGEGGARSKSRYHHHFIPVR